LTWVIFNEPVHQKQTIFDIYYRERYHRLSYTRTKKIFQTWKNIKGSIYKIVSTNYEKNVYELLEMTTEQTYIFRPQKEVSINETDHIIGLATPLVNNEVEFFSGFLQISQDMVDELLAYMDGFIQNENNFNVN